jgi:putative transposase
MTNHVHLLLTPHSPEACALFMKRLGQCYVQTVNKRLQRTGTLWEGRFYSCPVPSDAYVLACYRYIELNPVRANIVQAPSEYPWSSYAANTRTGSTFVRRHDAYRSLGLDDDAQALAYRNLCENKLDAAIINQIRWATRAGCAVGSPKPPRGRPPARKREMGSVPVS